MSDDENEFRVSYFGSGIDLNELEQRIPKRVALKRIQSGYPFRKEDRFSLIRSLQEDLLIISLRGIDPSHLLNSLVKRVGMKEWERRKARVILRTQNSHRQLKSEIAASQLVDRIFIAHPNYLPYFSRDKASLLPCAVERVPRQWARSRLEDFQVPKARDVIFPFNLYLGESRNLVASKLASELDRRGISYFFGRVEGWDATNNAPALWTEIASSRIVLNIPVADDFNMRNFESALLGVPQVSLKIKEGNRPPEANFYGHYEGDSPIALAEKIESLLVDNALDSKELRNNQDEVLRQHFENDRILRIIQEESGFQVLNSAPSQATQTRPPRYGPPRTMSYDADTLFVAGLSAWKIGSGARVEHKSDGMPHAKSAIAIGKSFILIVWRFLPGAFSRKLSQAISLLK